MGQFYIDKDKDKDRERHFNKPCSTCIETLITRSFEAVVVVFFNRGEIRNRYFFGNECKVFILLLIGLLAKQTVYQVKVNINRDDANK